MPEASLQTTTPTRGDVPCRYLGGFLDRAEADALLTWALAEVDWRGERVQMFGRTVEVPRLVAWFGDPGMCYRYSGIDHRACGWPAALDGVRARVEAMSATAWNFVLLNRYRTGRDHMGWHRDDESMTDSRIASLSLGATRRFLVEPITGTPSLRLDLEHGSLLLLERGRRHCLPRTRRDVGERINLTFRALG